MAPGDSFDPRTWKRDDPAPVRAAVTVREPARQAPAPAVSHKWWVGPLLSAAILAGGAAMAYADRADPPANALQPAAD